MTKRSSCCGGSIRQRIPKPVSLLPPNLKLKQGVSVIYLGSGDVRIVGEASKLTYYVSDHRRHFKVLADDVPFILRNRDFMLEP